VTELSPINPKKLRVLELLIVLLVPLLPSVISSLYIFATKDYIDKSANTLTDFGLVSGSIRHLLAITLLLYVLYRQGRKIEDIGLSFRWIDIPIGIVIFIIVQVSYYYCWKLEHHLFPGMDVKHHNLGFLRSAFLLTFIYSFINPFFEELIVRAYGMTEIEFLTGSKVAAIIIMTLFQSSYHLYQGLFPALMTIPIFLIYSLYFARYKKIMPVIIAHLIIDMIAAVHLAA
jgi:membrane protease YdiL (CAAX protease family)